MSMERALKAGKKRRVGGSEGQQAEEEGAFWRVSNGEIISDQNAHKDRDFARDMGHRDGQLENPPNPKEFQPFQYLRIM